MNEQRRRQQNKDMLLKIDKSIRPAVAAVIADLEHQGERPLIDTGVWRSPAEQLEKFADKLLEGEVGVSLRDDEGRETRQPRCRHRCDANKLWNASREFWLRLGASALKHNLGWGGCFGLPKAMKESLAGRAPAQALRLAGQARLGRRPRRDGAGVDRRGESRKTMNRCLRSSLLDHHGRHRRSSGAGANPHSFSRRA